jgi:hypothetical protein
VISTPSLPLYNRFASLDNTAECSKPSVNLSETLQTEDMQKSKPCKPRLKKWERHLPKSYTLAANLNLRSLSVKVELQTTNTAEVRASQALIDSGATGHFLSKDFVAKHRITMRTLSHPIPIYNVDGTPNKDDAICEVVSLILRYWGHTERANFTVTALGTHDIILGFPWLREHNLRIDWQKGEVVMDCKGNTSVL